MTRDPAQAVFEPTGELFKDYCAYCETEERDERDDVLDAIALCDSVDSPRNAQTPHTVHTKLFLRSLEYPLYKRDMSSLANAIPHCGNLYQARFYGCSLSVESWKILVEAVHKSSSLITVAVDFNGTPLGKDPTVSGKKEKPVFLSMQATQEPQNPPPPAGKNNAKKDEDERKEALVKVPEGWHAMLLTRVQEISLRGNMITDKQVKGIASLLETSTELLSLNLWGNMIRDEGVEHLAAALRTNHRLTSLNIGNNRITDDGLLALVGAFRQLDIEASNVQDVRSKVAKFFPHMPADPPGFWSHAEMSAAAQLDHKEVKKPPPKGKGKDALQSAVPTSAWDKTCVKISPETVRVPGNTVLWSLNVSNNRDVTEQGVRETVAMLEQCVPERPVSRAVSAESPRKKSALSEDSEVALPPLPSMPGIALRRLIVGNPSISKSILTELDTAVLKHVPTPPEEQQQAA
eukprot:TRINITY_DN1321_c1_g1_i1.p1 TRINITY_DN1321_c1_g1~~TRINITY_DN1321_c1_g1_i1.p1  ORF type:complete len:478 (+),score=110.72 TRINITY_DN1321_c1_g1_i1:51-1436(+)